MKQIEYSEGNEHIIDFIKPLWQKLNKHHQIHSPYFSTYYEGLAFEKRKRSLLEKAKTGKLRIFLAKDAESKDFVGYCVSTVSNEGIGEIESLYVSEGYRENGIGHILIEKSLNWINIEGAVKIIIGVAKGNDSVLSFYAKYGFYTKTLILEKNNRQIIK